MLAVHAALERLIAQNDENGDAVKMVIDCGHQLPDSQSTHISCHMDFAPSEDDPVGQIQTMDLRGPPIRRIGRYCLRKSGSGFLIFYRVQGLSNRSNEAEEEYHITYDPKTLAPISFGIYRTKQVWTLTFGITIEFRRPSFKYVYGKGPTYTGYTLGVHVPWKGF